MIKLLNELDRRLTGQWTEWTDDGNTIYGALVVAFGDYGTSPHSGWFDDNELIKQLRLELVNQVHDLLSEETDDDD